MFCRYCGTKSKENAIFCGACGEPIAVSNPSQSASPVMSSSNDLPAHPESQRARLELDVSLIDAPTMNEAAGQPDLQVHPGKRNRKPLVIGIAIALVLGFAIGAASFWVGPRQDDSVRTVSTKVATVLPHSDKPLPPMPIEVIDLQIDFDGTLLWNKIPVDRAAMQGYIEAVKQRQPNVHVTVDKFVDFSWLRPIRRVSIGTYIDNNAGAIVNYGERRRCGGRISTGFVESTINQLVAKRFVKKQQMRWTPRGAHLLLQVRVHVLNDELGAAFRRWYPKLGTDRLKAQLAA
jgi:hypothetical protein